MIGVHDAPHTLDFGDHYRILPSDPRLLGSTTVGGTHVSDGFSYTSESNEEWMTVEELRVWIEMAHASSGAL